MKFWKIFIGAANLCLILFTGSAGATVIYSSMPTPYPHNLPSLGYQATSTQEFGDQIQFAGTDRVLSTVTVAMSDWAKSSDWISQYPTGSYDHLFTLNLYNAGNSTTPGSLITSLTTVAQVPLRPDNWDMNGILFNITFNFNGQGISLPDEIVYGLAFNTQTHGYNPLTVSGPYNSLNFALNTVAPSVGVDVNADSLFWNTSHAGFYADGGVAGTSTFRNDTGWSGYVPAVEFNAVAPVPEPSTLVLLGAGLAGAVLIRRKVKK